MPGDAIETEAAKVEEKTGQEAPVEPAKELEGDAPNDKRPKANVPVEIDLSQSTVNVMPSCNGKVLMTLGDGGFQYLCGAARTNIGVKAGRYLFEVKIVECRSLSVEGGKQRGAGHSLMIGLTGAGCSLFLGENANSCAFDNEGLYMQGKWKNPKGKAFGAYDVVGLLLNLEPKSPNANTISLFVNGVRASEPQPIPESLHGKAVYPTLNFKNMTLHTNFGPSTLAPLPFTCHMLQDAAKADVEVTAKKSGKKEIIFPVGLPDEGTYRFVDHFVEENHGYTELSDRAIVAWAENSGVWQAKGQHYTSNERPGLDFGIRDMDETQLRRSMSTAAAYYDRSYVVAEVKRNLLSEERKKAVAQYDGDTYKRVAVVAMGEPPKAFKAKVLQELLDHKKWDVGSEVKRRRQAEAKEKAAKKAQAAKEKAAKEKEAKAAARKEAAEKKKADKAADEDKEKEEEAGEKAAEGEEDEKMEEKGEDAAEEKEKEEEPAKEEEAAEEEEPEESLEDAIKKAQDAVVLTDEEKALWFPPADMTKMLDVTSRELSSSFSSFSIPTKEEGFDEVRFAWANAKASEQYLQAWIKERKLTQRVEDLQPGPWFKEQLADWQKLYDGWRNRQTDWNNPAKRERKKAAAEARKKQDAKEGEEGDEKENQENEENEEENKEENKEDEPMPEESAEAFDANDIDAFDAEDIDDLGNGEPLYAHFAYEDWTLLSLRFQLHLLVHAFAVDMNDPERSAFTESHVGFYFKKYFKNEFTMKNFNCSTFAELMELIPDILEICQSNTLGPLLSNDSPLDNFVRLTEESRRERLKRIDAGDETAVLKFSHRPRQEGTHGGKGKGGKGKTDRPGYGGKPVGGMAQRSGMGPSRTPMVGRAGYGAPPPGRAGYGQGPMGPMMHGPHPGMYGPPPGYGGPPPGYGGPPPGYGGPPPGYGGPPPGYGGPPPGYGMGPPAGYGPPPGRGGMKGEKRGSYGMGPPGGMPARKESRGSYGGDRGDRDRGDRDRGDRDRGDRGGSYGSRR